MQVIIAGHDITNNVVIGQYKVNRSDVFEAWTDANGRTHRNVYRTKTSGTFDVFFKTMDEFSDFVEAYQGARTASGVTPCTLWINNAGESASINAYVQFTPVLDVSGTMDDFVQQFEITIEEY